MGILSNIKEAEVTAWVHIRDKFEVLCRYLPQRELSKLVRRSQLRKRQRDGSWENELDEVKWAKNFVDAAVLDWQGLTIDTLAHLMPLDEETKAQLKEQHGDTVPYSPEDAKELCERVPWRNFAGLLNSFATDIDVALETEAAKNELASSTSANT